MAVTDDGLERRGPIFLLGAMGSGTTLLRLMLDSHPNIAVAPETGFMRAYNAHRHIPFKKTGRGWANRLGWTDAELDAELSEFYDKIFMRYAVEHGSRRWGEKTPSHIWHVKAMARLFPDATFVGIFRHPAGSVASNTRRFKRGFDEFVIHCDRYTKELVRVAAKFPDRFALLRYEDLVLQPETTMRELLDRLGEPWSDDVLRHHEVQSSRTRKRDTAEGQTRVEDPIDVTRVSKWRTYLDEPQKDLLRERFEVLSTFFGYDVDDATVLEPLDARGSLVIDGHGVRGLMERTPGLVFELEGDIPRFEQLMVPWKWTVAGRKQAKALELEMESKRPWYKFWKPKIRWRRAVVRRLPAGLRVRLLR